MEVPFGPLYSMSRDELLVLRKALNELLDKGFIRVSRSPAAAPILFVKKPGGGLRFCVDYRSLNAITKKDRYPLPLINDTLERISKATWFTKLDVIAAFHKIRIEEGSEWMTAFRTGYRLFEWLVTPFGLANAPSTFQRYVNWTLREFLDDFVSAYIDDVLIFTNGSLNKHREHVTRVLERLQQAGLYVDIDKCEFEVTTTKYLGFIIEAGKGLRMDPAKVEAIVNWSAPTSVKGVRAFLGFANFYRRFIKDFSAEVAPLDRLTKKNARFISDESANGAFERLKKKFMPTDANDERYTYRHAVLLQPDKLQKFPKFNQLRLCPLREAPSPPQGDNRVGVLDPLASLWNTAASRDETLSIATQAVREGAGRFPAHLHLKVSISECSIDRDGALCFRNRKWVPDPEPLRTGIVQRIHDDLTSGHPGREITYSLIARHFFWPGMSNLIRQFCHNCHGCRANQVSRQRKQGLLKPLPIPDRVWRDISVDFITDLPRVSWL